MAEKAQAKFTQRVAEKRQVGEVFDVDAAEDAETSGGEDAETSGGEDEDDIPNTVDWEREEEETRKKQEEEAKKRREERENVRKRRANATEKGRKKKKAKKSKEVIIFFYIYGVLDQEILGVDGVAKKTNVKERLELLSQINHGDKNAADTS